MLKKIFIVLLAVCGILLSFIFYSSANEKFSSLKADIFMSTQATGESMGKIFMKGDKSRIELSTSGMSTVTIISDDNAYMYMPAQNIAMKLSVSKARENIPSTEDYKNNCESMGDEQIDGKPCRVYRCIKNGQSVTMWVSNDFDFPLKIISQGVTTYYKNVNINVPLDDELFMLPQGVQYQDMNALMQRSGEN